MADEREPLDFYETFPWQVDVLLDDAPLADVLNFDIRERTRLELPPLTVLEPCVGTGNIERALARRHPELAIWTSDIKDYGRGQMMLADATRPELWAAVRGSVDWVITNPPFGLANEIVPLAYSAARIGVAFLLRISWLEPTEGRSTFHELYDNELRVIPMRRASYTRNGKSDNVAAAWFVWTHGGLVLPGVQANGHRGQQPMLLGRLDEAEPSRGEGVLC